MIESELFGHEKGAFTGALARKPGRFEKADGGTLFLDEIGDLPQPSQATLLRVLQERKLERVGGTEAIKIDTRLVAATNHDLLREVDEGRFRRDLYDRLCGYPIRTPSLRERPTDIPILILYYFPSIELDEGALDLLCRYAWPGNVRQLTSTVERLAAKADSGRVITTDHVRREMDAIQKSVFAPGNSDRFPMLREGETLIEYICRVLLAVYEIERTRCGVKSHSAGGAGWLVFGRDGALLARPFDTSRLEFTGESFSLSDKVGSDVIVLNYPTFSVSNNGVLVFDPSHKRERRQYRWMDRRGQQINSLDVDTGLYNHWLSPNKKGFIADRTDPQTGTSELWMYDVSGDKGQRFTFNPAHDFSPVWEPSGSRVVWSSTREGGVRNLYQKAASGAGEETLLLQSDYLNIPTDWSRDGRFIIYSQADPKTKLDVWVLPATGSGKEKPFPVVPTKDNETAGTLSPDERWLAYASNETGQYEVYVQSFPGSGGKRQVSNGGGSSYPRWQQYGKELFYYSGDGKLMAVPVRSGASFEMDAEVSLFEFRAGTALGFSPYAVTADGQRFLINEVVVTAPNAPLTVVVNWAAVLKK